MPILLDTEYFALVNTQWSMGPRKSGARWLNEETVTKIVTTTWEHSKLAWTGPSLANHTKVVRNDLDQWDQDVLKSPKK